MKSIILINFLLIAFVSNVYAQNYGSSIAADNTVLTERKLDDVKGFPYIVNKWSNVTAYTTEGQKIEGLLGKYNAENDAIEVLIEDKLIELNNHLYNKITILAIDIEGNKTVYNYENGLISGDLGYYNVIYKGKKVSFVEKVVAKLLHKTVANYGLSEDIKKYVKTTKYFIILDDKFIQVKKNKKSILGALGNNRDLERHIKKNKLKLRKNFEIRAALDHFENLESN